MYLIGYVLKPQGIRGEVKIDPVSPDLERFKRLDKVYLRNDTLTAYSIENVRLSNRFVFMKFSDINTRNDAELLRNCEVLIDKEALIKLSPGEFFVHDLVGCEVFTEEEDVLGKIIDVMQIRCNDVYVVMSQTGQEFLIPAIKDVIKLVDIKHKKIIIHRLEGMI
jgi:16S rRNA processing protein RimM